jgi:hypothetical protein
MYKTHQTKTDIDRLLLKGERKGEYNGFLHKKVTHKAEIINTADYFDTKY